MINDLEEPNFQTNPLQELTSLWHRGDCYIDGWLNHQLSSITLWKINGLTLKVPIFRGTHLPTPVCQGLMLICWRVSSKTWPGNVSKLRWLKLASWMSPGTQLPEAWSSGSLHVPDCSRLILNLTYAKLFQT